jgi:quinone-modifying oxidoreductase, subunit QmoC
MVKEIIYPGLYNDLEKFGVGVGNWSECFHCGNCTATCPLTETENLFPRKEIRLMQIGLKNELASCAEPWLCYYCGDCSKQCPRDANPGELMMALRRWLTTVYDWTGLARRIYTSKAFELGMIAVIAIAVMVLFILFTTFPSGDAAQYISPDDGGTLINNFASWHRIHFGDWLMAGTLAFILAGNVFNMWLKIIVKDKSVKVPFSAYLTQAFSLPIHFLTKKE